MEPGNARTQLPATQDGDTGFHKGRNAKGHDMSDEWWVFEKRASGRGNTTASEIQVSLTACKSNSDRRERKQIGIRISRYLLKRVGWQPGDFICVRFNHREGVFELERTTDSEKGFKLSQNGKAGNWTSSSLKFGSFEQRQCDAMFPNGQKSRACVVLETSPAKVVAMFE